MWPWTLYVAVSIDRYADVVVSACALARDTVISAADIALARKRISATRTDYLSDVASAVGRVVMRALPVAQVLGTNNVKAQRLVKRGDEVILTSAGRAISVRVKATALEDGVLGARISVRNLNSARVVEGVVDAAGVVIVPGSALL